MSDSQIPAPPEGVSSPMAPPDVKKPDQIRDALARFDAEVAKARAQPSRAMIALKLGDLAQQHLPDDLRHIHAQLRYETYPKADGGLGVQIDGRRNPHALGQLEAIRRKSEEILRAKRMAIESAS